MKVLVLGSGGREHALAWRIRKDPQVEEVYLHPGNAGTWSCGIPNLGDVSIENLPSLIAHAQELGVSLVVIGPEALLAKGYADAFRKSGFPVSGPGADGAQLETSKAFAKEFLEKGGIPTAAYTTATTPEAVRVAIRKYPSVLKLDGLAAGKGVVVAQSPADAEDFIRRVWELKEFGNESPVVVVEDFIAGRELSYIGLCDTERFVALSTASDYKRVGDGDQGPNTGGMGAISPSPIETPQLLQRIEAEVVQPTLRELKRRGIDYRGALYFGLMVAADGTPYVLEFNARFGDPETQALLMRIEGDFTGLLVAAARRELSTAPDPKWTNQTSVYVVAAADGYPATPRLGDTIQGLDRLAAGVQVFFSGVGSGPQGLVTQGGRVLGLGALGKDAQASRSAVYTNFPKVSWPGLHYRRDIGL